MGCDYFLQEKIRIEYLDDAQHTSQVLDIEYDGNWPQRNWLCCGERNVDQAIDNALKEYKSLDIYNDGVWDDAFKTDVESELSKHGIKMHQVIRIYWQLVGWER